MGINEMLGQFVHHRKLLFDQGFLDNQFVQLQLLQDESNPDFVLEVVSVFFDDSERILNDLSLTLTEQNVDFKKVDAHVHQLKGSSSRYYHSFGGIDLWKWSFHSIGAQRVKNACIAFRNFCEIQDVQSCRACLQQVKQEYFIIKENLQKMLMITTCCKIPTLSLNFIILSNCMLRKYDGATNCVCWRVNPFHGCVFRNQLMGLVTIPSNNLNKGMC
ncbi:hypothetical protein V2J09_013419 [Rumex salicifolius]